MDKTKNWTKYLYLFWIYTLLVILWGAWVRISHSGDGCGDHWPLCGGEFIPNFELQKTWVEYSHRLMSGVYGLIVISFFFRFRKAAYSKTTRSLSLALFVLMIIEAGLGALLVKGALVTENDSIQRLVVMSLHQLNSFILTGVTYLFAISLRDQFELKWNKFFTLFLVVAVSGAIASLSTTLFPSISVWQGILSDFNSDSHLFIKLRILHPILALTLMGSFGYWLFDKGYGRMAFEIFLALGVGVLTLLTLSPVWLKLTHLLIAHLIWARLLLWTLKMTDSSQVSQTKS